MWHLLSRWIIIKGIDAMDVRRFIFSSGPLQSHCCKKKSVTVSDTKLKTACFPFKVWATFKFIPRVIASSIRINQEHPVLAKSSST